MDRKSTLWVGVAAAVLLIAWASPVIWRVTHTPPPLAQAVALEFKCDTCGKVLVIEQRELSDLDTCVAYSSKYDEAVPCRECGAEDAREVCLCRQCGDQYASKNRRRALPGTSGVRRDATSRSRTNKGPFPVTAAASAGRRAGRSI